LRRAGHWFGQSLTVIYNTEGGVPRHQDTGRENNKGYHSPFVDRGECGADGGVLVPLSHTAYG
jgi:hypothetical protein